MRTGAPEVVGAELVAEKDRGVTHALLDHPAAFGHIRDQLEHAVALLVCPLQEPALAP